MTKQIYINLPVKDLNKSIDYFTKLGFSFDKQFTDDKGTCMIVDSNIFVMLLTEEFFITFTKKEIPDSSDKSEVILTLSVNSNEEVNSLIGKAVSAGGIATSNIQEMGWMYGRGFQDINGHLWEVVHMDMEAFNQFQKAEKEKANNI